MQDETVRNLKRYAELIPEPYREVFHLRIYGELSLSRSENAIRKGAGWARVTCHRARQMIRAQISQEEKVTWKKINCNVDPGYSAIIH